MKKFLTTILAASMMLIGSQAFAQVSVGAGYKMLSHKTEKADATNLNGAFVGVDYNIHLVGGLGVAPGIYYSFVTKSDAASGLGGLLSGKGDWNEHYITVPVHFNYGFNLGNDVRAFVFAGPSADFGLASSYKLSGNAAGVSAEKTIDMYDNDSYKRFDVKLGGGIGVDLLDVTRVKVGYDFGMLNRGTDNATMHSNQLYVGVSLLF
ncbi:MAG: PorT family protein [Bacteroidales bacterium]|nr:PorT family protein [Bacteroidales bacterium]